jgi:hypothetical protein
VDLHDHPRHHGLGHPRARRRLDEVAVRLVDGQVTLGSDEANGGLDLSAVPQPARGRNSVQARGEGQVSVRDGLGGAGS